jgi:hypothetical protein
LLLYFCADPSAWGALAKAAGGSGVSANLSSNSAIRKQQLIADPEPPDLGSNSVMYNPATSLLADLSFGPGYVASSAKGSLILLDHQGKKELDDLAAYVMLLKTFGGDHNALRAATGLTELGYVQVAFQRNGTPGRIPILPPYVQVAYDPGTTLDQGVDTFALFFDAAPTYVDGTLANYSVFAAPDNYQNFTTVNPTYTGDFFQVFSPTAYSVPAAQISPASVKGAFVPEPGTAAVFGLVMIGLALRRPARSR